MNEIELMRRFRAHSANPDNEQAQRARGSLMAAIAQERSGTSPVSPDALKIPRRRILAIALATALLPGGYAIAQAVSGSGEVRDEAGNSVPVASCPEADAAFERAGLPAPDIYVQCPTPERLDATIQQLRGDVDRLRSFESD